MAFEKLKKLFSTVAGSRGSKPGALFTGALRPLAGVRRLASSGVTPLGVVSLADDLGFGTLAAALRALLATPQPDAVLWARFVVDRLEVLVDEPSR